MVFSIIKREVEYFSRLQRDARALLATFFIAGMAGPLLSLFTNAFIWRETNDLVTVIHYNLAAFAGIMAGFIVNGWLGKIASARLLYAIGFVAQGLAVTLLFFTQEISLFDAWIFGGGYGLAAGLYWANRNLFTLAMTKSEERNYFCNLELAIDNILAVIMPALVGWCIELAGREVQDRYRTLIVAAEFILLCGSALILQMRFPASKFNAMFVSKLTQLWTKTRILIVTIGVFDGISYLLPPLLSMRLVGGEGLLGSVMSFSALLTALALYAVARKGPAGNRLTVLSAGIILLTLGAANLALFFNGLSAVIFLAIGITGWALILASTNALILDLIDNDAVGSNNSQYAYVVDRELFLAVGRAIGLGVILTGAVLLPLDFNLRLVPLLLALPLFGIVTIARGLAGPQ